MRKLLVGVAIVGIGVGAWQMKKSAVTTDASTKLLVGRVWIDHIPTNERDTIQAFGLLTERPLGFFNSHSQWKGEFERFRYIAKGDDVQALWPHTGAKEAFIAHATRCDDHGMDFCLELEGASHGVTRYYSREGWEITTAADGERVLESISP